MLTSDPKILKKIRKEVEDGTLRRQKPSDEEGLSAQLVGGKVRLFWMASTAEGPCLEVIVEDNITED